MEFRKNQTAFLQAWIFTFGRFQGALKEKSREIPVFCPHKCYNLKRQLEKGHFSINTRWGRIKRFGLCLKGETSHNNLCIRPHSAFLIMGAKVVLKSGRVRGENIPAWFGLSKQINKCNHGQNVQVIIFTVFQGKTHNSAKTARLK